MKLFIVFLFASSFSLSQNLNENYIISNNFASEAEYFFHEDNFDSAIYYYQKAFEHVNEPHPIQKYKYAKALWLVDKHNEAIEHVLKSQMVKIDTIWFSGLSTFQYDSINKQMLEYREFIDSEKNVSMYEKFVDSIMSLDQLVRKGLDWSDTTKVNNMNVQDKSNAVTLLEFTKKHGFPAGKNSGWGQTIATMLLHMPPSFYSENYALLYSEVVKGNLEPFMLAWGIDRAFALDIGEDKISPNNRYWHESKINPFLMFYNCISIGVSPYYDFNHRNQPRKTVHFEYYKENKKYYNTILQ